MTRINHKNRIAVSATASIGIFGLLSCGCASDNHTVIAATSTTIGVEIGQDPASGATAVLGYKRAEFARVPSNRPNDSMESAVVAPKGANETGDVLMELRYTGLRSSSGIYQRLAVGSTAVMQPGASLMFARDADGNVDPNAVEALKAIQGISVIPQDKLVLLDKIAKAYDAEGANKEAIDQIIASKSSNKYLNYNELLFNKDKVDVAVLESIEQEMATQGHTATP